MVETVGEVLEHGEVIVIGNKAGEFDGVVERLRPDQVVVDLVRVSSRTSQEGTYYGIGW
jgi:GDP-mannose 6-dehydrogenase